MNPASHQSVRGAQRRANLSPENQRTLQLPSFLRKPETILLLFGILLLLAQPVAAQPSLERKIDSLFVIASSGEVRYRDLNEPAMDSIAAIGQPAVPYLIDKFTTKSARDRWTILWILQRIGEPAVPDLINALDRTDELVVQRVAWALGDIGDTAAVLPLVNVSDHDAWQVREQSIGALGRIADNRADDAVTGALNDPIGQVRKAAVVSAGELKIHEAVPRLIHRFGDEFYGARLMAVETLLKLDTTTVLEALTDSINSDAPFVADLTARTLGRIGTDRALETLYNQATSAPDPDRRAAAAVALVTADPKNLCGYHNQILAAQTDRLARLKVESALTTARHGQEEPAP